MTEMRTWTHPDRTAGNLPMPEGPWDGEFDKAQWIDEETGLDCLILRNHWGTLCGYVGVPNTHPWHGVNYGECMNGCETHTIGEREEGMRRLADSQGITLPPMPKSIASHVVTDCWDHSPASKISVHGDLTFSGLCQEDAEEGHGICHIPEPGRPANVWWFGFDCGHWRDVTPMELARAQAENFAYPFTDPREEDGSEYRDVEYVKAEVARLAKQLKEVA